MLHPLFYPRTVAVIGSAAEGKIGHTLISQLIEGGYGSVFAVNPKSQGVGTVHGFESVSVIGSPVDLAVIASPASTVSAILEDCGKAGVKTAIVITAGFSETGNINGENELKEIANRYGIRFAGPNCAGVINNHHKLSLTLETVPPPGKTALVSQSGALGGLILSWAEEQGLGFSKFISYGNAADISETDLLEYLLNDSETEVVALYVESVKDGRRFHEVASRLTKTKPLVVIKSGRTESGRRAAQSHTGSMAGSDAVFDSVLSDCGAMRVYNVEEMFDLCKGLTSLPPLKGKRIAVVTNSGGPGVMTADHAESIGLDLSEPGESLREKLSVFLPPQCALKNPVDLTVEGNEDGYRKALMTVLEEYDAAIAVYVGTPSLESGPIAAGVCRAAMDTEKPVVPSFMAGRTVIDALKRFKECGLPNFTTGERAVSVLAKMAEYEHGKQKEAAHLSYDGPVTSLPARGQLLEPEAMTLLKENDLPVPRFSFASNPDDAVGAAAEIGYPVVMKVVSPDIIHKSEFGGVIINITNAKEVEAAFEKIEDGAAGKDFRGVVIYPMIKDAREVILGLYRDPQFGPVVAFGMGGIYTEIIGDIALSLAPLNQRRAARMIREIKTLPLLEGMRGQKAVNFDLLERMLVSFSLLPFKYPDIAEMDLNPVFLKEDDIFIGDVRIIRA
ncbi:MAG: acetate--CoA ligase family protein [Bacillota bacterium]|nr:acetate--CoA ligase family protein [Bacillota bacterium]MDW7730502.1 acetate--CoA ligase family protein [Bacillota bacterium]